MFKGEEMKAFGGDCFLCFCKCHNSNIGIVMYRGEAAEKEGTRTMLQASVHIHGTVAVPSVLGSATVI